MWEEKPLRPISSTHSIQSEPLCKLAVWINPVFSLPTVDGKRREKHHLFLLFIFTHPGGSAVKQACQRKPFIHLYVLLKTLLCYKFALYAGLILRRCTNIHKPEMQWPADVKIWRKYTHVDTLACFQLQMLYNVSLECALSHLTLYQHNTSGACSVWNLKMNLLCRW